MNLVTGATGILGSHVALQLVKRNEPVIAARRAGSDLSRVVELFRFYEPEGERLFHKLKWIEVDVTDYYAVEQAVEQATSVYHCAGYVSFDPSQRRKLFRVNEEGTANVVNACLRSEASLCHTSSVATIRNSDVRVLNEDVYWKRSGGESDYALSKYAAEREVWRGMEEGLQAVIVNPGVILAPVFWDQSSGRIFQRCAEGLKWYSAGLSPYISAFDASRAMVDLLQGRHTGNRYILAEGNYDLLEVLTLVHRRMGKPAPSRKAGKNLLRTLAWADSLKSLLTGKERVLTKSLVESALNRQTFDNSKVRKTLDFEFTPLPRVLDEICGYYRTVSMAG